jgi:RNA polymerase sigma-70 factor (ECF subfamily)
MTNSLSNKIGVGATAGVLSASQESTGALSFGEFYNAHLAFVARTARRLAPYENALDDVVQDVFVIALRRFSEFSEGSPPRAWLFGILRNVLHKHRHARKARCNIRDSVDPEALPDDVAQLAPDRVHAFTLLTELLASLDEAKREVFVLAELEQMTAEEIAVATETRVTTVNSRLRDARQAVQAALHRHRARDQRRSP